MLHIVFPGLVHDINRLIFCRNYISIYTARPGLSSAIRALANAGTDGVNPRPVVHLVRAVQDHLDGVGDTCQA